MMMDGTMSPSEEPVAMTGEMTTEIVDLEQRYEPRTLLGRGGMGEVWLYGDGRLGRDVALKRLNARAADTPKATDRFLREARIQALVEHPSVVPIYDLATSPDGEPYFTMRRIRGRTLGEIVEALNEGDEETLRRFSRRKLLNAFVSVCLAIHYAHEHGVVHRDLKPENVMFGDFGEVYVLDWGVAKVLRSDVAAEIGSIDADEGEPSADTLVMAAEAAQRHASLDSTTPPQLTADGEMMGTPAYMSPEQMNGESVTDRADIYSLGLILFELLAQRPLHQDRSWAMVMLKAIEGVTDDEPPLDPPELDAIWRRAAALQPTDRYPSTKALADDIERFLDGDRDAERRKELAGQHAQRAVAAAEIVFDEHISPDAAASARVESTDEVMRALALDPKDTVARQTLARLLVEAPAHMPEEAEREWEQTRHEQRNGAMKWAVGGFLAWAVCIPVVMLLGVQAWAPFLMAVVLILGGGVYTAWLYLQKRGSTAEVIVLAAFGYSCIALFSCWLGPFVLVPTAATAVTLLFATQTSRKERSAAVIMGTACVALPFLIELTGLLPPAFSFVDGDLVLHARAVELPAVGTWLAVAWTSISFTAIPTVYFGRLKDDLTSAERRLFLHAWQLGRMAGTDGKD